MKDIIDQLILHEGVVPHAYADTEGYLTIGVGRLIDRRRGGRLSDDEIRMLLANDVERVLGELDARLPWWRRLDAVRGKVLIDMAFNLGIGGLLGFRNTLAMVERGDFAGAARGMLASKWARQVKGRARRLAGMMETGEDYG